MPTLAEALGPTFGGGVYTIHKWNLWDDVFLATSPDGDPGIAPSAPPTPTQQSLPTSAYGQTIPVIYGKARVPGAYIWAPGFDSEDDGGGVVTTLTARLRFARPLVANSNWRFRKVWADGKLIADRTQGFHSPRVTYLKEYAGQASQGRDPLMVEEEGEDNVSAHRGYIDFVIKYALDPANGRRPPVFEAEWIQDPESGVEVDTFSTFVSDVIAGAPAMDWASGTWYGMSGAMNIFGTANVNLLIRKFRIGTLQELYSVPLALLSNHYNFIVAAGFRYIPSIRRLVAIGYLTGFGGHTVPILIDPVTGEIVAEPDAADTLAPTGHTVDNANVVDFGNGHGLYVAASNPASGKLSIYRFTATTIGMVSRSADFWDGRGSPACIAVGAVGTSSAVLWIITGPDLYKVTVSMFGAITSISLHYSHPTDDLIYVVAHDGDAVVWTDAATALKIDGSTASVVWSASVPYQIVSAYFAGHIGDPGQHRFIDTFLVLESTRYNLTDLNTGETEEIVRTGNTISYQFAYDGGRDLMIETANSGDPRRVLFDVVGDGTLRDLEDFLAAVTVVDNGFSGSQHQEINITDQIQGAVIDVTSGVREVARNTCGPYRIAIFDRAGVITYKRALTDGSFAVDFTLSASDFKDSGGQAIVATRRNPREFLARYGIAYRDPDEIYQTKTQYGEIQFTPFPLSPTDNAVKVDIPVIHNADTIKTLATKTIQRRAVEQHSIGFGLKAKYLDIEPEDIAQFTYAGRTINARVTEMTINPNFTVDVTCTEFLTKVAATVAGAVGRPTVPSVAGDPESSYYHLDIPLLSDGDDLGGAGFQQYHVLTSQGQDNWAGATLYRQEGTYIPVSSQDNDGLVGVALELLPDWEIEYVTEFTRTLRVAFTSGDTSTLASATYQEVCEGANMFAIGAPGRWEVCHVMTITDNGDGTHTFEGLRRGRGVSEEHTASHQVGDQVVWLSGGNVQHLDYGLSALGDAYNFKPVGEGGTLAGTTAVSATITGEAEKIPKPSQLAGELDGADIVFSWRRSARLGSFWADDGEDTYTAPLGESLEQYEIRIKDGPGGTIKRTETVNDVTEYTYTAANQTADFGGTFSAGDDVTFDVRQISGTGVTCPRREATVTL